MADQQEKTLEQMDYAELRKMMIGQQFIKECDMPEDMKQEAGDIVQSGIEGSIVPIWNAEAASRFIKETLDKKFGPTWQCVIGEGFAYDVTVQNGTQLFMFYNGNLAILVFKS